MPAQETLHCPKVWPHHIRGLREHVSQTSHKKLWKIGETCWIDADLTLSTIKHQDFSQKKTYMARSICMGRLSAQTNHGKIWKLIWKIGKMKIMVVLDKLSDFKILVSLCGKVWYYRRCRITYRIFGVRSARQIQSPKCQNKHRRRKSAFMCSQNWQPGNNKGFKWC